MHTKLKEDKMFPRVLADELYGKGIVAVLTVENVEHAVPAAKALLKGGISAIELVMRTDVSETALKNIVSEVPGVMVGVGTILTPSQVDTAKELGGTYGVAPGFSPNVVKRAEEIGLPFAPGISTPTEIEAAVALGCRVLKLFPAEPLGGLNYLKAMHAAYRHLDLQYIPLGGVSEANLSAYLEMPEILAIGGSWIAAGALLKEENWDEITRRAEKAYEVFKQVRG